MPTAVFPRSTPSAQGVDAAGVEAFLDAMAAHPEVELHSLMLLRNGHVVTEGWWSPYTPERVHLLYSLSKSFASTAAGFAVAEGLLDLDRTVLSYFPELDADVTDERSRSMLVRHVAAMASGHDAETIERVFASDPDNVVRGFLRIPPEHEPGSWFAYNQPCTYSLAAIVQRESGQGLIDYLTPRLFAPLGIGRVGWQQHPPGQALGFTGLHATTDAIAKLGQLYLQRGWWGDRRLLPEEWVDAATSLQVANPLEDNPDWRQGYGFQFWLAQHGYRGDGAYGQFCVVLPEQQTVVAITGASLDMQAVLDGLWTHLLPGLGDDHRSSPDKTAADVRLARRMTSLALAPATDKPEPEEDADLWDGAVFTPAGGTCEQQRNLTSVELHRVADDWRITLAEGDRRLSGIVGADAWQVSDEPEDDGADGVPVAVSGGWDSGRLVVEVLFLETPHRLTVSCDRADATFTASWGTVPLRAGTLHELRKPD
ncbi:MAG TPA: serine hydrolase domain-containing protein [Microlunatus sp.]